VPNVSLDRSGGSLHRQIARQIGAAIHAGALAAGARLPSTRCLSRILGVGRNSVVAAYEELEAGGFVCVVRGAGVWVNGVGPLSDVPLRGMRRLIGEARFPVKVLHVEDSDGNQLYLRY
jgi:GntR family transcriptional regulator/MocR family aminotransferase